MQPLGATGVLLLPPHAPQDGILENLRDISDRIAASRHQPSLLLASAWLRKHLARVLPSLSVISIKHETEGILTMTIRKYNKKKIWFV